MMQLDYRNMLAPAVTGGIAPDDWARADSLFEKASAGLQTRRSAGELGFLELPGNDALHSQSVEFAKRTRGRFDDIVVLGIGGSALGPIALRTALRKPQWNLLD